MLIRLLKPNIVVTNTRCSYSVILWISFLLNPVQWSMAKLCVRDCKCSLVKMLNNMPPIIKPNIAPIWIVLVNNCKNDNTFLAIFLMSISNALGKLWANCCFSCTVCVGVWVVMAPTHVFGRAAMAPGSKIIKKLGLHLILMEIV